MAAKKEAAANEQQATTQATPAAEAEDIIAKAKAEAAAIVAEAQAKAKENPGGGKRDRPRRAQAERPCAHPSVQGQRQVQG